jgi:hypothetical protein
MSKKCLTYIFLCVAVTLWPISWPWLTLFSSSSCYYVLPLHSSFSVFRILAAAFHIASSHLCLSLPADLLSLRLPSRIHFLYSFFSDIHATCTDNFNLLTHTSMFEMYWVLNILLKQCIILCSVVSCLNRSIFQKCLKNKNCNCKDW